MGWIALFWMGITSLHAQFTLLKKVIHHSVALFQPASDKQSSQMEFTPSEYDLIDLDLSLLQQLRQTEPQILTIAIPSEEKSILELDLQRVNLFSPGFAVYKSSSPLPVKTDRGLHYQGKINGNVNSIVAISLF